MTPEQIHATCRKMLESQTLFTDCVTDAAGQVVERD